MTDFTIFPAIDLRHGRVVRLYQGDYARQTDYDVAPESLARRYRAAGARWLHVVDLDGARDGVRTNQSTLAALVESGLRVQAGGGVRCGDDVEQLLETGVARVVVGSLAVRQPERVAGWLARYGAESITLALDARWREGSWRLATAGWTRHDGGVELKALARFYVDAGVRHVLCTDIDRDGAMSGANLELYRELCRSFPGLSLQASGGVRDLSDVRAVGEAGAAGVVLGRSLLEGRLKLDEALAIAEAASC